MNIGRTAIPRIADRTAFSSPSVQVSSRNKDPHPPFSIHQSGGIHLELTQRPSIPEDASI